MSNYLCGVDWVELHEPINNQIVYISLSTGITSEKKPLNVEIKNAYEFDWWELLDAKSNRHYYFNTKTKQTTWIKPQCNSIIPFGNVQFFFSTMSENNSKYSDEKDFAHDPEEPTHDHRHFPINATIN